MIKQALDQDLKTALLSKDSTRATLIRALKSAILYAEVATGQRENGLSDDEIIAVLQKEAKKRQESADLYQKGGSPERAAHELAEKTLIEVYLPPKLDDAEVAAIVKSVIDELGATSMAQMGQVIAAVKQKAGAGADSAVIARIVKESLS